MADARTSSAPGERMAFIRLAVPLTVSRLGVAAMGIVDGVMLAHADARQLAVHGLAEPVIGRLLEIGMLLVTAGLPLIAELRSRTDVPAAEVGRLWRAQALLAALLGAVLLLVSLGVGPLLGLLGQPDALVGDAGRVASVLGLGFGSAFVALLCAGVLEALQRPVLVAVAVVLANLANAALNQWLIFGGAGLPPLGAVGAAWSTTLVRTALAVALLVALCRGPLARALDLRPRLDRSAWAAGAVARRRGLSAAGTAGVLALLSLGMPVMAGWLGADAVAQVTALWLALAPLMVPAWGMADAAGLRVAEQLGRRPSDLPALRATALQILLVSAVVLVGTAALLVVRPGLTLGWAVPDGPLRAAVVALWPLGLTALVLDGLSGVLMGMLRSLDVLRGPFLLHLFTGLVLLPLAAGLAFGATLGLQGLLLAHVAMAGLRLAGLAWLFADRTRPPLLADALACLPAEGSLRP